MSKHMFIIGCCALLGLASAGCSSMTVRSDFDSSVDFAKFSTYRVAVPSKDYKPAVSLNQINQDRIINAINREMASRGYASSETSDLTLHFYLEVKDKQTVYNSPSPRVSMFYGSGGGGYHGYSGGYGVGFSSDIDVYNYTEGTLVIDMVDNVTNKLVWQGVGVDTISQSSDDTEGRINKAITAIFGKYPLAPAQ